jgi:hypothetical protein
MAASLKKESRDFTPCARKSENRADFPAAIQT